jgi:hypothetical protein
METSPQPNPAAQPTNPNPGALPIEIDTGGLHSRPEVMPSPGTQEPLPPPERAPEREQPTEPDIEPGREGV